ncbi:hypothetical protein DPMN_153551 [Dreissena polymorpha]|uniref:Uncharacterized protein n=1 Tax=Dreissena polymorpha TaxID=45954 RepID=A0A9D4J9H4_DREPO|nr:hypothetical protein DPMN_153551 [Dreissena polymorpha]
MKRTSSKSICYKYDTTDPSHCAEQNTCSTEPLTLSERITRNPHVHVTFTGWTDPFPSGGNQNHSSGIESFEVYVNEIVPPNGTLSSLVLSKKVNQAVSSVSLNLTSNKPKLYCITLETKDFANNVRHARRFVLYDNQSFLNTSSDNLFKITSASNAEHYIWQTHHKDLCVVWKEYFYNKFYLENKVLNPIKPNSLIPVDSIYEQNKGILPVSGTPNIDGIVGFVFHWTRKRQFHVNITGSETVPVFQNQQFCKALDMEDGDTFYIQVEAIDIANNRLGSNRTLFIDRTAPQIVNIGLLKNGVMQLFVHDTTDLSRMTLYFETYDSHSGIRNVKWTVGIVDTRVELGSGVLAANNVKEVTCLTTPTFLSFLCYIKTCKQHVLFFNE